MKYAIIYFGILLLTVLSFTVAACGDDDDELSADNLAGTSWVVTSDVDPDGDDNGTVGTVVTSQKNGTLAFLPLNDWTYATWAVNGNNLTIILGEGIPDDFMQGQFVISGNTAVYTYHWGDVNGEWEDLTSINVMTLVKQ